MRKVLPKSEVNDLRDVSSLRLDGVDIVAGLHRVLGNQDFYKAMLDRYLVAQVSLDERLVSALATRVQKTAKTLAHSCKRMSVIVGANAIAQAACDLERAL